MTRGVLDRRLAALEAGRAPALPRPTLEDRQEAARRYEATLLGPEEPDPRATTYWAEASPHQIAADYDAMLKGAPAPWEIVAP